jgi:hypothetical protein
MPFTIYQPNTRTASDKEEVRISKSGFITISARLSEKHLLDCQGVQLLYDGETRRVAIKPVRETKAPNTMKVSSQSGSRSKRIAARGFLEFCGYKAKGSVVVAAEWNTELAALVFGLPQSES